jgi:hypothetical protein
MNGSKSDQWPDKWAPLKAEIDCQYVTDWEAIKQRCVSKVSATEAAVAIKTECSYLYFQKRMQGDHRAVLLLNGLLTRLTN